MPPASITKGVLVLDVLSSKKLPLIKPKIQETFYDLLNITRGGLLEEKTEHAIVLLQSIFSSVVKENVRLSKGNL